MATNYGYIKLSPLSLNSYHVYVLMYVLTYTHIHTYVHTYIHTYISWGGLHTSEKDGMSITFIKIYIHGSAD